jgi:hypothetical protein
MNWSSSSQRSRNKSTAFYSMGITNTDFDKFKRVMARAGQHVQYVCVDVANGYHENFVNFIEKLRGRLSRRSRSWPATSLPAT